MSALHFLYVRFADDVCAYVRGIVRDSHEAEDVTQNVFTKLMTSIHRYEERDVPFAAWIITVARNVALDHVRARRQIPVEEVRTSDEGHEQTGFERSQCLREALSRLPDRAARGARAAPHRGPVAERDRRAPRQVRGLHPRPASPRPRRSPGSAPRARRRADHGVAKPFTGAERA